jgi:hypothetical protein
MEPREIKNDEDYKVYLAEKAKKEADWNKRRIHHDPIIKPRVIYWFVHLSTEPPTVLGFIRGDHLDWAVIGGPPSSHLGFVKIGQKGEWWVCIGQILSSGYIPIEQAVVARKVPPDWSPPPLSDWDARLMRWLQEDGHFLF